MADFYLGNGSKRPKRDDYRKEFGINAEVFYRLDKIKYEQKQDSIKSLKETNKKASKYASSLGWGILPPAKDYNKKTR